jgi:glycosyltransferase involved in cell wall biosynthesis
VLEPSASYAFVQHGSFSHCNDGLFAALEKAVPNLEGRVIDVSESRRFAPPIVLNVPVASVPTAVRELGRIALTSPRASIGNRRWTTYMFDYRTALARKHLANTDPRFVLQTQTLFDARVADRPFYIYTDHTVLANRRYPVPPKVWPWSKGWIDREREAYRSATFLFVASGFARDSLVEDYGCDPERVVVCHSGLNVALPDAVPVREGPVRTLLFAGIDWNRKGGPVLVNAFRLLRKDFPDLRLVVVGSRPTVSEPGIEVVGRVGLVEMDRWFRSADVFCMPSWIEPAGVVYSEAAAFGLPVIGTSVGGTEERVIDGETGYICKPGDVRGLAGRLRQLIQNPELASDMGRSGRILVESRFTWDRVARTIASRL